MKLLSNPTVVDGQNHSKNRAYRQQCASDYLVVLFFFFFFITFSSYPKKTQKQLYIIKKGKIWENPRKVKKKKKKFVGRLVVDFGLLVTDLITLYNIIIRYH
jgi:hypothetical protein